MRQPFSPLSTMDLLQKSKYSHLRNESVSSLEEAVGALGTPASPVESLAGTRSLPGSLSSSSLSPMLPLGELSSESEDSPTTLCSFFPKMANLKLSNPANLLSLRGSSAGSLKDAGSSGQPVLTGTLTPAPGGTASPDSVGPVTVCSQDMNKLSCAKRTRVEGGQLGGDEWTRHGSFVNKPTRGWLHPDDKVMGPGVSYHVWVSAGASLWGGSGFWGGLQVCLLRVEMNTAVWALLGSVPSLLVGCMGRWGSKTEPSPVLTLLSSTVHGLRRSPSVHEGFGFQHKDSGHQVSPGAVLGAWGCQGG